MADHKAYRGRLHFRWKQEEGIYGLGQAEEGSYNYRGHDQYLYQHNMRIPMPAFLSDRGYGMLFDCGSLMTFHDDIDGSYLFFDTISQMEYYFIGEHTADGMIRAIRSLTGRAAMLPKWAFGYIQSKEQYYTAKELAWTLDIGGFFTVGSKWQNRGCGCNTDPMPKWFWQGENPQK